MERNYSALELEFLSVVWTLQTRRPYLLYEKFTVYTDQIELHCSIKIIEPFGCLTSWRLRLAKKRLEN